jgi:tetratricopeptide (TPR) repeat protein
MTWRAVINHIYHLFLLSLLASLLSACGSTSSFKRPSPGVISEAEKTQSDLMYQILAGEFAGVSGDVDISVDFYQQAAKLSHNPEVSSRAAYIALYAQQYDEALKIVERWQLLAGNNTEITRAKTLIFLHQGKATEAAKEIEQLLLVDGKIERANIGNLGQILKKEARPGVAISVLTLINKHHPEQSGLLLLQARFEASEKLFEDAKTHIDQVIKLSPEISDAYLIKAQIFAAENKEKEAVAAVAIAVEKRPEDHRLRLQYARMLVQMRHYDEAWQHFMQLKEVMPNDENILLSLGLLSIETGKADLAKQYLQQLIDHGFHNLQAHYYLGRIQQSQREYMPAIANYERVTEGTYMLDARIRTAGLLAEIGQVDKALSKLIALNKGQDNGSQIKVYLAQGEVLRNADRDKEALGIYNTALQGSPENTDLLYARALTAEKLDMLDITESDLRMVLIHEPENATALNALGYTLADRTQRLDEAKEYILKAAKLLPNDPSVLDSLGWVYYRLGEYAESIKWLSKAFAQYEDAEIAAHLGEVLWMNGQQDNAGKIWQRGLEMKANHPVLLNTIKRYKK